MSQLCHHNTSNLNKRNKSYEFKNSCEINHQKSIFVVLVLVFLKFPVEIFSIIVKYLRYY